MKFLRTAELRLDSVKRPTDWDVGLEEARITRYADRIRLGQWLPPIVIDEKRWLVSGRHRLAAHDRAGSKKVAVVMNSYVDPGEREEDSIGENLHRGHLTVEERRRLTARLVSLIEDRLSAQKSRTSGRESPQRAEKALRDGTPENGVGRPHSVHREAIRTAAAIRKVSEDTVERDLKPAAGGTEGVGQGTAGGTRDGATGNASIPPPIETFGMALSDELEALVRTAQTHLDKAAHLIERAVAELTPLRETDGYDSTKAQELREIVRRAGATVRAHRPTALCPWCKGEESIVCMACRGQRFATRGQLDGVPAELLDQATPRVSINGAIMPLAAWRDGYEPPENKAQNGKRGGVPHGR